MYFLRQYSYLPSSPRKFIYTLPSISILLKACKTAKHLQQVHVHIIHKGLEQDCFVLSQFICLSNSLLPLSYSSSVFNRVSNPNVVLWNSLIKVYCEKSQLGDAVSVLVRMKRAEVVPDGYTHSSLITACSKDCGLREGKAIHGSAVRCGVEGDVFVDTSMIDFYGKCREIGCARKIFNSMIYKNVISWTAIVVAYVSVGDLEEAKKLFDEMPQRNAASWNAIICGFVRAGDLKVARLMFDEMPDKNIISFTTLIDGYAKTGDMASAKFLFEKAPNVDIVAWSALISGYVQNGQPNEAVKVFIEMGSKNVKPDDFILVSLMSACSQLCCLELAKWADSHVLESSLDYRQPHVWAAIVDMNAKCGNMERATALFEQMPKRDLISYCSMIQGLSVHGRGAECVDLFNRMIKEGLIPDEVAFTVILTACSRAGLVDDGWYYFESMRSDYHIVPSSDHYSCMIDLLSRTGQLRSAYELLQSMPVEPNAGAWGALLGACKLYCDIELGEVVANRLFELEPNNAGNYVLLSNIYAAADRWLDVSLLRDKMKESGARKITGRSWI